ncbi:MAG TPA: protein-glutamate O-methyltransferase CheR [Bacteroidales bacterium]|nr:protein-glutamate O-methyltransferase CheR [Bacteroidales bacterium]
MHTIQQSIADSIGRWLGIHIGPNQFKAMMRSMSQLADELGWGTDAAVWAARLNGNPEAQVLRALARYITIGETYFFREQPSVDFIRQIIVPEVRKNMAEGTIPYSIWSAACSSGEEPYSVVMLLLSEIPSLRPADVQVLATDVNPEALSKARSGIYRDWSFRATSAEVKEKYFKKVSNTWVISDQVRDFVRFKPHNLIADPFPFAGNTSEGCNLVLCRNVFIYFDPHTIQSVADRFFNSLKAGGWLITSQVELNDDIFRSYIRIARCNGFFYRKPLSGDKNRQQSSRRFNVLPTKTMDISTKSTAGISGSKKLAKPAESLQSRISDGNAEITQTEGRTAVAPVQEPDQKLTATTRTQQSTNNTIPPEPQIHAEDIFLQAMMAIDSHQPELASELMQKVLYLEPLHYEARFQYAHLLRKLQQPDESVRQYQLLIKQLEKMKAEQIVFGGLSAEALTALCNLALERHG